MKILFDCFALFISVIYYQYRGNHQRCFIEKLFLKISKYSQETLVLESILKRDSNTVFFLVNIAKSLRAPF